MDQIISELAIETSGEGFVNITSQIQNWIKLKKIFKGILLISSKHTSCSLIINENADPNVLKDLSAYMRAIVPEEGFISINGDGKRKNYLHCEEGIDDMPAHIKTMLTSSNLSLSVDHGELNLGTWQAIYLWEHRFHRNLRRLNLHLVGEIL